MFDSNYVEGVGAISEKPEDEGQDEPVQGVHVVLIPADTPQLRAIMRARGYHGESWLRWLPEVCEHTAYASCPECGLRMAFTHESQSFILKVVAAGLPFTTMCFFCAQIQLPPPPAGWAAHCPPPFITEKRETD